MAWLALVVEVEEDAAEALADALLEGGAQSVSVEDADAGTAREHARFAEPGSAPAQAWQRNVLRALVDESVDVAQLIHAAAGTAGLRRAPVWHVDPVPEQDWVRLTQAQFEPIRISARLWIVPSWHVAPDPHALNIALDPGLAFGTGSHPTTRLCLQWLERRVIGGEAVLDYGCGSGILAIAAAKLGARAVTGVDVDPVAVAAARENASRNEVAARFFEPSTPLDLRADLVVANILASPLKLLAPLLAAHTRTQGRVVLAGLLAPQSQEVSAAYAPWFDMRAFATLDGWTALEGVKR